MNSPMDPDEDVELGAHVAARARGAAVGAVVAVRLSRDLLARMGEHGRPRRMTVSEVLRLGAERLVGGTADLPAEHE